jgi:hypothetical protein
MTFVAGESPNASIGAIAPSPSPSGISALTAGIKLDVARDVLGGVAALKRHDRGAAALPHPASGSPSPNLDPGGKAANEIYKPHGS